MAIPKYILVALFIMSFTISCNKVIEDADLNNIVIDNNTIEQIKDVSDFIDEITIIPLNESIDEPLGDIFELFVSKGNYVVFDRLRSQKIMMFDKNGNFIKTIMKTGNALNETLQINDCWINDKDELEVYDYAVKKIYQFDSTYKLKTATKSYEFYLLNNIIRIPNSDNYVGYAGFIANQPKNGKFYQLAFLDKNLNIFKTDLCYDKMYNGIEWLSFRNNFYIYKDSIRFFQAFDNYIYDIKKSGVRKKYKLIYKNNPLPDDIIKRVVGRNIELFKKQSPNKSDLTKRSSLLEKYTTFRGGWFENDKYIYITSTEKGSYFFTLFNKEKRKAEFCTKLLCETERYKMNLPFFEYYDPTSNSLLGVVFGEEMKNCLFSDSKFLKEVLIDPEKFYIVKVKLTK